MTNLLSRAKSIAGVRCSTLLPLQLPCYEILFYHLLPYGDKELYSLTAF